MSKQVKRPQSPSDSGIGSFAHFPELNQALVPSGFAALNSAGENSSKSPR